MDIPKSQGPAGFFCPAGPCFSPVFTYFLRIPLTYEADRALPVVGAQVIRNVRPYPLAVHQEHDQTVLIPPVVVGLSRHPGRVGEMLPVGPLEIAVRSALSPQEEDLPPGLVCQLDDLIVLLPI